MDEGGPFKLVEVPQRTGDDRWEATFEKDGRRVQRLLSEEQSRALLRITEGGKWEFSLEELDSLTAPPG
ncbi:MAG TPA: hypothetical protein VHI71_10270 [Actinomycetota bacterium]|nr:hypothetical protein [Actinomycetota bacterium]